MFENDSKVKGNVGRFGFLVFAAKGAPETISRSKITRDFDAKGLNSRELLVCCAGDLMTFGAECPQPTDLFSEVFMIFPKSRFKVAHGYYLQFEERHGTHVLRHRDWMVELSETAYEVLSLVDQNRTFGEMIETLSGRVGGVHPDMADEVRGFLEEAHAMGWIAVH